MSAYHCTVLQGRPHMSIIVNGEAFLTCYDVTPEIQDVSYPVCPLAKICHDDAHEHAAENMMMLMSMQVRFQVFLPVQVAMTAICMRNMRAVVSKLFPQTPRGYALAALGMAYIILGVLVPTVCLRIFEGSSRRAFLFKNGLDRSGQSSTSLPEAAFPQASPADIMHARRRRSPDDRMHRPNESLIEQTA